jgi:hypothetical protein
MRQALRPTATFVLKNKRIYRASTWVILFVGSEAGAAICIEPY